MSSRTRSLAAGLVVLAVLAAGCGGGDGVDGDRRPAALQPAEVPATPEILEAPQTDNYKWWFSQEKVAEERTSLLVRAVNVGGQRYTTTQPGTTNGAQVVPTPPNGLPLKSASGAIAYLKAGATPPNAKYDMSYRVFGPEAFGVLTGVKDKVAFPNASLPFTLSVNDAAGTTLAQVKIEYKYDQLIANQGDTSLEHKGPGGRWFVDGKPAALNWPAKMDVALPANAVKGTAVQMKVTALDLSGLAVAYKNRSVQFTSAPNGGATLPPAYTFIAGDNGAKTLPVTFTTAATHQVTATTVHETYPKTFTSSGTSAPVAVTDGGQPPGSADVTVSAATNTPSSAWVGNRLKSVVTVKNLTADKTATSVKLATAVPVDMKITAASASSGTCTLTGECSIGTIPGGGAATVTITATPTAGGAKAMKYTVSSASDPVAANNVRTITPTILGSTCTIVGTEANNSLVGTTGNDVLCGLGGDDSINGGGGNDTLYGGEGHDTLGGGDGDDALRGGPGDEKIDGGTGSDRVSVEDGLAATVVNLTTSSIFCKDASPCGLGYDSGITGIERATGSPFADIIYGSAAANSLAGGAGDDLIYGQAGNDSIAGNAGADNLNGGLGSDSLTPGAGTSADTIRGNEGVDTISYGDATARVVINLGTGKATGQGTDTLIDIENAVGSPYADTLTGKAGANTLNGMAGNDVIYARDGAKDTILGGVGTDSARYDSTDSRSSIEKTLA